MKQKTILIMLCAMFLSGCGNSESADNNLVIDFSDKTDIYVQEEKVVESKEKDAEYFYQFEEVDIYCYPDIEKILLDNHIDTKEFSWTAGHSLYADEENFLVGSFLNNGKMQLIYHPVIGTGTGVLIEELHIVDLETLDEYSVPDFVKEAESMVDMEALVNAEDLAGTENEVDLEKIFVGAYQYYQVEGDKIYVNLNVSVQSVKELGIIRGVLEEKDGEILVSEWHHMDAVLENCVNLCKGVIEGYFEGIESEDALSHSQLFYSENLFEYTKKKAEVVRAMREKHDVGMNAEKVSFEVIETKKLDNAYYIHLQVGIEGAFSNCYLLVAKDKDTFKVADIYFEMKDGIDGYTTGLLNSDRKIDNPEIWNNEIWVESVMDRLSEYEEGVLAENTTIGVPMYLY